jgi:hypothetical protein
MQRKADSLFESAFPIDDGPTEVRVPSAEQRKASPVEFGAFVMELIERGERASQRNDHAAAARYYRALVRAVPEKALSFSLLCNAYDTAGVRYKALEACAAALGRSGATLGDFQHYVRLVLTEPGALSLGRIKDLDAIMQHLAAFAPGSLVPAQLRCDIAVRELDDNRLRECTGVLHTFAPSDPKTLGYEWVLALRQQDFSAARDVIARAKQSAMPSGAVRAMQRATEQASSPWLRARHALQARSSLVLGAALGLLLAVAMILSLRQRRILRGPINP